MAAGGLALERPCRTEVKEILPGGRTAGKRSSRMGNAILIHRLWPTLWLDGQGLGRNMTGKLVTKKLREGYVDRMQSKEHEDICIPYECSTKGDLSRGGS